MVRASAPYLDTYPDLDTAPVSAPAPAAYPKIIPPSPPERAAASASTPFMGPTPAEQLEEIHIIWSSNILNHPHVKSWDNEIDLLVVCIPCTLADGGNKKYF